MASASIITAVPVHGVDTQVANLTSAPATEVASSGDSSAVVARCRREYVVTHDFAITQSSPADR